MGEAWRLFVAVPIDDALRRDLEVAVDRWRARSDLNGLRWAHPASWHLTLAFLGATDPSRVPSLVQALETAVAGWEATPVPVGGVGGFPTASRARVAWYGVHDSDRRLAQLAAVVRRALGVEDSPFRGHLTVARARRESVDLRGWIRDADAPAGVLPVERVDLVRSHLGRGPARYQSVATLRLGATAHV